MILFVTVASHSYAQTDSTRTPATVDTIVYVREDMPVQTAPAYSSRNDWLIGLNLTNNLTNLLSDHYLYGGSALEITLSRYVSSNFMLKGTAGYTNMSTKEEISGGANSQYITYRSTGSYIKAGIYYIDEVNPPQFRFLRSGLGLQLAYSQSTDEGKLVLPGPYFGNYQRNYTMQGQQLVYLEVCGDINLYERRGVGLLLHTNIPFVLYDGMSREDRFYFMSGYGRRESHAIWPIVYYLKAFPYRFDLYLSVAF